MNTVIEQYVSCRAGLQVDGMVYGINEVIPGASVLRTLPALLRTGRVRIQSVSIREPEPASKDLGVIVAEGRKTAKKKTAKR
jgi:hypothetical protein